MRWCHDHGVLYIDTVVEHWAGFYFETKDNAARTNYALRQAVRDEKARRPGGPTAVSCCGADPGMVIWFVKEARLMQSLGVKGIHIAERDAQARRLPRPRGTFVNTWSVDGFVAEGLQPAGLGWGTHERWFPEEGHRHASGCRAAIWIARAAVRLPGHAHEMPERHRPAGDLGGARRHGLAIQRPYLGPVATHTTDWKPLTDRCEQFDEDIDETDPWQFRIALAS